MASMVRWWHFCGVWCIWEARNRVVFQREEGALIILIDYIRGFLLEYWSTSSVGVRVNVGRWDVVIRDDAAYSKEGRWVCLPNGCLPLSCDVFWDAKECKSGIGWVLRDHMGELITANGRVVRGLFNVLFIEVQAVVVGLHVVSSIVKLSLVVESANVIGVRLLNGEEVVLTLVQSMVEKNIVHKNSVGYSCSSHSKISKFGGKWYSPLG